MTKSPTRIGIVEDNDLLRLSLGTSLAQENLEIVFSVSTALEALELIETAKIDVLIADLHLGETINGIDVSLLWQKAHPDLGVVYLTSYEDPRLISGGKSPVMADNSVYVTKSSISEIDQLVQAVNLSLDKKGAPKNARTGPLAKLTDVQMETLGLPAQMDRNQRVHLARVVLRGQGK